MDGFRNITISNFRGIEHLTMEDFARVNILVGQNNCGKSTVLEALLFATGMSNPYLPQRLNAFRSRNIFSGVDSLKYLFRNMDLARLPRISASQFDPSKTPPTLTIPAKKTKIYAYLETLLDKTRSQKELIKDRRRNYENPQHWNLDAWYLEPLKKYLVSNINQTV